MTIRYFRWGALIASLMLAAPASAQIAEATDIGSPTGQEFEEVDAQLRGGMGWLAGGLGDLTGLGVTWGVQATAKVNDFVGLEAAYDGARIPIADDRLTEDAGVFLNGVQALAKGYLPIDAPVEPFVGVGLGLTYANPGDGAEDLYQHAFIAEIPIAAGVEYSSGYFVASARGNWTPFFGESFADTAVIGENPNGSQFGVSLSAGAKF